MNTLGTNGIMERALFLMCLGWGEGNTNLNRDHHIYLTGYALDAPEWIPAGSTAMEGLPSHLERE